MAACLIRWARLQPPELGQVFVIHQNTFRVLMYSSHGKGPVRDISILQQLLEMLRQRDKDRRRGVGRQLRTALLAEIEQA